MKEKLALISLVRELMMPRMSNLKFLYKMISAAFIPVRESPKFSKNTANNIVNGR